MKGFYHPSAGVDSPPGKPVFKLSYLITTLNSILAIRILCMYNSTVFNSKGKMQIAKVKTI